MSQNQLIRKFVRTAFKDYFLNEFDELFLSNTEGKKSIINELWNKFLHDSNDLSVPENESKELNMNISYYIINKTEEPCVFEGGEIIIIEMPKPTHEGEISFVCLGVGVPPGEYSTIYVF
jgi:hypothetical protein